MAVYGIIKESMKVLEVYVPIEFLDEPKDFDFMMLNHIGDIDYESHLKYVGYNVIKELAIFEIIKPFSVSQVDMILDVEGIDFNNYE